MPYRVLAFPLTVVAATETAAAEPPRARRIDVSVRSQRCQAVLGRAAGDLWFQPHASVGATMVSGSDFGAWVKSFTGGRYDPVGWFDTHTYPDAELMFGARIRP